MTVLRLSMISLICSIHMVQNTDLTALEKMYTYEQVEILERVINRLGARKEESHIHPLIHCLENHVNGVLTTHVGNDHEKNLLAGFELYGDAVLLLQESLLSYFQKYGTASTTPESQLLFRALQDILVDDDGAFVNRGFASDFSTKNETLYLVLPGGGKVEGAIGPLQKLIGFRVKPADLTHIGELIGEGRRVAVLEIDNPLHFHEYYLIRYSLEFKGKERIPNSANMSSDIFYRKAGSDFKKIN